MNEFQKTPSKSLKINGYTFQVGALYRKRKDLKYLTYLYVDDTKLKAWDIVDQDDYFRLMEGKGWEPKIEDIATWEMVNAIGETLPRDYRIYLKLIA